MVASSWPTMRSAATSQADSDTSLTMKAIADDRSHKPDDQPGGARVWAATASR